MEYQNQLLQLDFALLFSLKFLFFKSVSLFIPSCFDLDYIVELHFAGYVYRTTCIILTFSY